MSDPLFGASFLVGILGNLLARHVDPTARSASEAIFIRLTSRQPNLPPNHDVERVCRAALRQSLELMAQSMDLYVAQPKTLVEAFKNRFDAKGRWKPMIEWWHTEEQKWIVSFAEKIASDKTLAGFNLDWIKGASSLYDPLLSRKNAELEKLFGDALLAWAERHVTCGKPPLFFAGWTRDGWPVAKDSPTVRISLFSAWCLFLQHHFKEDEGIKAILTVDWLRSIDERLCTFPISSVDWTNALCEPLGTQLQMLMELRDQVQNLADSYAGLMGSIGQLLALVLEFRGEVGAQCSVLRSLLGATHAAVVETYAVTMDTNVVIRGADQKLNDVLAKLGAVLAAQERLPVQAAASPSAPQIKRIAESKLLASDGASRFIKLVGRAQEKALLTRAWRDGTCRVLSFVALGGAGKTSLIVDWLVRNFIDQGWAEVDAFFDWSFYSQGTRDQSSSNSEMFFSRALHHFGEAVMAKSSASAEEKASCLAAAMAKQHTLLVLDGLEPLQHPSKPGHEVGRLKDSGIAKLLRLLAQSQSPGLCIVTTRVPLIDLRRFRETTVREVALNHLSVRHGAELLHLAGAQFAGAVPIEVDDKELLAAVKDVKGHAMTLQMLGGYLGTVKKGDIRRRDRVDFKKAFEGQLEGHTYNVMAAYEQWFKAEGLRGMRQLAVLRMLGLFDRVADAGCIQALLRDGGITGVSDAVAAISEEDWQATLTHLCQQKLVFVDRDSQDLDAHPLLREYFAQSVRDDQPEAWRAAHQRLYEYLCANTHECKTPTLEDLQPLYQAVGHGCQAGLGNAVFSDVLWPRILQGEYQYSWKTLGAIASDLSAVAYFFESPWDKARPGLSKELLTYVFGASGFYLNALSRFQEAASPMEEALRQCTEIGDWKYGSRAASNLSELHLVHGQIESAMARAKVAVKFADIGKDDFFATYSRSILSECLFSFGDVQQAKKNFEIAESLHFESDEHRLTSARTLVGVQGFRQNKFELGILDRSLWKIHLGLPSNTPAETILESLLLIENRAQASLIFVMTQSNLLNVNQAKLILVLVWSCRKFVQKTMGVPSGNSILYPFEDVVNGIRRASLASSFVEALLYRAQVNGWLADMDSAQADLNEAWEIAERAPMKLCLADIHLHRARLFFRKKPYPWESPVADLTAAEKIIHSCGYKRRDGELVDAKWAILGV